MESCKRKNPGIPDSTVSDKERELLDIARRDYPEGTKVVIDGAAYNIKGSTYTVNDKGEVKTNAWYYDMIEIRSKQGNWVDKSGITNKDTILEMARNEFPPGTIFRCVSDEIEYISKGNLFINNKLEVSVTVEHSLVDLKGAKAWIRDKFGNWAIKQSNSMKIKVGDIVKIRKKAIGDGVTWNSPHMDKTIGKTGKVIEIWEERKRYCVDFGTGETWNYNIVSLENVIKFGEGDRVIIARKGESKGKYYWNPSIMNDFVGKPGTVKYASSDGTYGVLVDGTSSIFTYLEETLESIDTCNKSISPPKFSVGSRVVIYKEGNGEKTLLMKDLIGKIGIVVEVNMYNMYKVRVDGMGSIYNFQEDSLDVPLSHEKEKALLEYARITYPKDTTIVLDKSSYVVNGEFYSINALGEVFVKVYWSICLFKIRDKEGNWAFKEGIPSLEEAKQRYSIGEKLTNAFCESIFEYTGNISYSGEHIVVKGKSGTYTIWDSKNGWAKKTNTVLSVGDKVKILGNMNRDIYWLPAHMDSSIGTITEIRSVVGTRYFLKDLTCSYAKESLELVTAAYRFKRGDKVKIVRKFENDRLQWNPAMDGLIGKVGKVSYISSEGYYSLDIPGVTNSWSFCYESLELFKEDSFSDYHFKDPSRVVIMEYDSDRTKSKEEKQIEIRVKKVKINYKQKSVKLILQNE